MSTYKCTNCNYATRDKSNFSKHVSSNKHIEKVKQRANDTQVIPKGNSNMATRIKHECDYCNNECSTASSLARHKKSCSVKTKFENNHKEEILRLKNINMELEFKLNESNSKFNDRIKMFDQKDEIIKQKDEIIKQKDETISILKSEVTHLKSIVNNTGSIIKTSVSTMAYVIKNYKDAPVLESVKDYSAIRYEQDNTEFVENLIYEHNNNKLHIYISDFIIKTYKKDDPAKQSLWNSDTSRLTYLIREIITNNKVDWKVDKKGIKTTKFIIEPILEYIDQQIRNYVESYEVNHKISAKEAERQMMKLKSGMEIIKSIETKVLSEEILKYITPHFYLIKNDESIEI